MSCTVEERRRVKRAARDIRDIAPTHAVEVIEPAESRFDCWTLDAVLRHRDSTPPEVLRELALAGLDLHQCPPKNGHALVVATA